MWVDSMLGPWAKSLAFDFQGQILKAVSMEWGGRLTWNERYVSQ